MSRDADPPNADPPDDETLARAALRDLAANARVVPTRTLFGEPAVATSGTGLGWRRGLMAAAACVLVVGAVTVLLARSPGDVSNETVPPIPDTTAPDTTPSAPASTLVEVVPASSLPATTTTPTTPVGALAGCSPDRRIGDWTIGDDGVTDYANIVFWNGRRYHHTGPAVLTPDQLGDTIGHVCFNLSEVTFHSEMTWEQGDATTLAVGSELRMIKGADSSLRIAVVTGQYVSVYEVGIVEDAEVGADLLDLTAPITEIWLTRDADARAVAQIDPATVSDLIDELAEAPVNLLTSDDDDPLYHVDLVRADGTTTSRSYWIDTNRLWPGINLPANWHVAIQEALAGVEENPPTHLERAGGLDGPVMYWRERRNNVSEEALIVGVLAREGDCLYASSSDGTRTTILWPYGTQWNEAADAVVQINGDLIAIGDTIELGGGYHDASALDAFTSNPEVIQRAFACTTNGPSEIAVAQ